ncbi:penicillin-insensitive murein endopeptidase [Rhizobium rhizosphaerae]|uniref:Penicillin-insensitive murein endopeptidase n=1 Tax=Xaviernesmea rhizosphaerae TaxID=1672749 RepID=A0A1Q9ACN4_9HYPH|nr:penicillin-insensitive murein endopeptidase [Xaviernesmea rhizosphaerae]OLP52654.1 penicillin-insensitive murein endopeptidase [Xaviernesmea rhizosphaerae]
MALRSSRSFRHLFAGALVAALLPLSAHAQDPTPAKQLFGAVTLPSAGATAPIGSYAKGCLAGGVQMPADGPTWQAMRLSRNRRWGTPELVSFIERFSGQAASLGWGRGVLVGDMSQPRGGPMLNGHASHQIGLDVDIWFRPMPAKTLSAEARETYPFASMLDKSKFLTVDSQRWTPTHAKLLLKAAAQPEVERIFVNPAIKKKLCDTWTGDRSNLGKIRPMYGHDEHFHIRLKCPAGDTSCKPQAAVAAGDGCDKSLAWWFTPEPWAKPKPQPKPAPDQKPVKPRFTTLADLPKACSAVLAAPAAAGVKVQPAPVKSGLVPPASVPDAEGGEE